MPDQDFLPVGLLKKQAHERWSRIYDQLEGVTKNDDKRALIEILALRELARTYLNQPEENKPKLPSNKQGLCRPQRNSRFHK